MTCLQPDSAPARNRRRNVARARGASRHVGIAAGLLLTAIAGQARAADWPDDTLRGSFTSPGYVRWDGLQLGGHLGISSMNTNFGDSSSSLVAYSLRNTTVQNEFTPSAGRRCPRPRLMERNTALSWDITFSGTSSSSEST
ncbi:MAG: hypothetical protein WDN48_08330 [Pseudolabrys sp.]